MIKIKKLDMNIFELISINLKKDVYILTLKYKVYV